MKRVVFSCAHNTHGEGPSRPLTRVHEALEREFGGEYEVIHPKVIGERLSELSRLGEAVGPVFDDCAAEEPVFQDNVDLLLASGGASLQQMRLGTVNRKGTLWFSSHWEHTQRVLNGEYPHYGIKAAPIHPYVAWRAEREQAASDFIVVPSEHCKSTYPEDVQAKAHVVEFGVDSEEFTPPERTRRGHEGRDVPLRILAPMSNPPRKGLRFVLEALNGLPMDTFELTITGGLQLDWGQLGPRMPPVVSTGWVRKEEMLRLYQEHDVQLMPSLEEGQALSVMEGAACGLPAIVTPECGYNEYPKVLSTVASGDSKAIREELVRLEEDRAALSEMGRNARAWAVERPWSKFQEGIVRVVKEEIG